MATSANIKCGDVTFNIVNQVMSNGDFDEFVQGAVFILSNPEVVSLFTGVQVASSSVTVNIGSGVTLPEGFNGATTEFGIQPGPPHLVTSTVVDLLVDASNPRSIDNTSLWDWKHSGPVPADVLNAFGNEIGDLYARMNPNGVAFGDPAGPATDAQNLQSIQVENLVRGLLGEPPRYDGSSDGHAYNVEGVYDDGNGGHGPLHSPMPIAPTFYEITIDDVIVEDFRVSTVSSSPLVMDISTSGDGISLSSLADDPAYWDILTEGFKHASGWITNNTGLLAIDLNSNGTIDNNSELFGNVSAPNSVSTANGFQTLAAYDSDSDGAITANDAQFGDLRVWLDTNHDGISQSDELHTLFELNITNISLSYSDVNYQVAGNTIEQQSTFTMNGNVRTIADAWFTYDPVNTLYNQVFTFDPDTLSLPKQRGYGLLPSLDIAMSIDNNTGDPSSLLSQVEAFSSKSFDDLFMADGSILQDVRQIMYRWAGVDDVDPTSRGPLADAQELGFLEAYMGQGYISYWGSEEPSGPVAADALIKAFGTALDHVYAVLMAQTAAADLFMGVPFYNVSTDSIEGVTGLNLTRLSDLQTEASGLSTTIEKDLFWRDVVRLVEYAEGTSNLSGSDQTALNTAIHDTDSSLTVSGILTELVPGLYDGITTIGTTTSETLTGTNDSDFLIGNGGNDTFTGNAGHDNMQGGAGNDTFTGNTGNDFAQGAGGNDVYVYNIGDGSDTIFDTAGIDKILLGAGIDASNLTFSRASNTELRITIQVGAVSGEIIVSNQFLTSNGATTQIETIEFADGSYLSLTNLNHLELDGTKYAEGLNGLQAVGGTDDIINGNAGDDFIQGFDGNDTLHGNDGNDVIFGGNGTDTLYGDAGNDTLDGNAGNDTMAGGTGNDSYFVDSTSDVVTEVSGEGNDTILTALNNYTLPNYVENLTLTSTNLIGNGNSLDNHIIGDNSNNTLIGGDGNDTIDGAFGADSMNGGLGNDTFIVDNTGDVVIEAAGQGADLVKSSVSFTLSTTQEIENLTLIGAGNINGTGNTLDNIIIGNVGNNTLNGSTGADTMTGGGGNDTFFVDNAGDTITGGTGIDTVSSNQSFTLSSELENLILTGSTAVTGTGNGQNNTLTGNTVADSLIGGDGNDTYVFTVAATVVTETTAAGAGASDTVIFNNTTGGTSYTLAANVENLTLGGTASIKGVGNALDNVMNGNASSNTLDGGTGNDTLWAGTGGTDSLIGGAGSDTFIIDRTSGVTVVEASGGTDVDTVQFSFATAGTTYILAANVENLILTGTTAINGTGTTAANVITGNIANNVLSDGGAGSADTLIGGDGNDTYTVNNSGDLIIENSGEGTDLVSSAVTYDMGANAGNAENLTLTGSSVLTGTGNSLANTITGNTGADSLIGGDGNDTYVITIAGTVITETSTGGTADTESVSSGTSGTSFTLAAYVENLTMTGSVAIKGVGNDLDNVMNGNSGSNTVDGGTAGNDTLWGGTAGTDTLIGGSGNDTYIVDRTSGITIVETSGTDTVQFSFATAGTTYTLGSGLENLILTGTTAINGTGNTGANTITGNIANNALNDGGAGSNDSLIGGDGDDTYTVNNTGDVILESANGGTDTVTSSTVSYTLAEGQEIEKLTFTGSSALTGTGNSGDNTLTGNTVADTLIGGDGNDTYVITVAGTVITEGSLTGAGTSDTVMFSNATSGTSYTLAANVENLTLTGSVAIKGVGNDLDNVINGNSGSNTVDGGTAGNDTLWGGTAGTDTLIGGSGNDTFIVDRTSGITIVEAAGGGTDTVLSSVTYTLGITSNLENLTLTGSSVINGTGNDDWNTITGNSAANTLDGKDGIDTFIGGDGNDTYISDFYDETVIENLNEGIDTVMAGQGFTLPDNVENLTLTGIEDIGGWGNNLDNTITGNSGSNVIYGYGGADRMVGNDGDDLYVVENVGDVVVESSSLGGTDTIYSDVSYTLPTNVEIMYLEGNNSNINATGNSANNTLYGNGGDNVLDGKGGADTLDGGNGPGQGTDGNDTYIVDNAGDVVIEDIGSGVDTIQSSISWDMSSVTGHNNGAVENLILTGTGVLVGTGNDLGNTLTANSAADTLIGGIGNDTYVITNASTIIQENGFPSEVDTVLFGGTTAGATYTLAANVEILTLTGSTNINGTGNGVDNIITGNSAANTLSGGGGVDTMSGGTGNDIYIVDDASDKVNENTGEGTDSVQSSVSYTLAANVENLTLTGTADINGTANHDSFSVLIGNSGANILTGSVLGANTLDGGAGADTLNGGFSVDAYFVDNVNDVINETNTFNSPFVPDVVNSSVTWTLGSNLENLNLTGTAAINGTGNSLGNTITGNSGVNILDGGGSGNDYLSGGASNDTLTGGTGNDTLDGGTGNDRMVGGSGNDTYYMDSTSDVIIENSGEGTDTIKVISTTQSVTYTLGTDVENLDLSGAGIFSKGIGNASNNYMIAINGGSLSGLGGDDILQDAGAGINCSLIGGDGNDTYIVNSVSSLDTLIEGSGVGSGIDLVQSSVTWTLSGNFENLTLTGGLINGTGNGGNNIITGNNFANTLSGGSGGNDTLFGMGGNDSLIGGGGDDTLDGGTGADTLNGGNGNDLFIVDSTADIVLGGANIDTVQSSATWTMSANLENLYLTGSASINGTGNTLDNIITGNSGFNSLSGSSGNDTLTSGSGGSYLDGGDGNDLLTGGAGLDTMHGGLGADTFFFQNATAFDARDIVNDFNTSEGDKIDLRDVLSAYDPATMNLTDFVKIENALNGADSILSVDRDGTGSTYGWTQVGIMSNVTGLTDEAALVTSGNLVVH